MFDLTYKQINTALFGLGVNSYNRFASFGLIAPKLKGKYYWYALREAYLSSDNLYEWKSVMRYLFLSKEEGRDHLMFAKERRYLDKLPQEITIYRGMTKKEFRSKKFGVSWTLKKEKAEYFAFVYDRNHSTNHLEKCVHSITINKDEVVAFWNDRKEFEVIYLGG